MLIKSGQESLERIVENALQLAALRDDTLVPGCKTFHECEIGFSGPNDISKSDLLGRFSKTNSARATSNGCQVAGPRQRIDDFIEMGA